jgi:hypothetical protein
MSYFGALPSPTAAQRKEGDALPIGPTAALAPDVDALTGKKEGLPLWVWVAGGAVAVFALLRKR